MKKNAENAKVGVRSARRDAIDAFKKQEKASEISEDELKVYEKDVQALTDEFVKKLDAIAAEKEKELLDI